MTRSYAKVVYIPVARLNRRTLLTAPRAGISPLVVPGLATSAAPLLGCEGGFTPLASSVRKVMAHLCSPERLPTPRSASPKGLEMLLDAEC